MSGPSATDAYVALGSNLGDSRATFAGAIEALGALPGSRLTGRSRIYRTPPWGRTDQPDFLNAVVRLHTSLAPHVLLDALMAIERRFGRMRDGERWGPRTLDLDLLHMDSTALDDSRLTLPHPRVAERAFVLLPLADLAPDLVLPGQGRVGDLLQLVDAGGCEPID
ncbi:MAG: 2-amino-4-hydroxy-6-hydroxymethyldihydropteridine diphosphokinase [Lysobacterales bacterium 13-68-4]|jgi:2-amino-4-hydroxy-6-hydroxymethyldihydropteridine diphosphokinase|nr:MAG: 2-amino-4-hydroxy-6-hydroxymethyldihydropteridine diphosphokinase [Xanthomonadales bacterium 15-68-25]OZB66701.1 MAG: 2-amino-4-hydroxy-6-hydroxymethyldihydropteridine diphosphokinase [Xanthomonadales bacterium 14-68-21]OZB69990.1 MAG: 2-amino-4-hydroxy-6-hydroxymethyldihydropteridine diphosphokinase [Xanthomonadales bacterium 13-68-4]